jgi:hypothetical protein
MPLHVTLNPQDADFACIFPINDREDGTAKTSWVDYRDVVQVDAANDLALLKADGRFAPLPIAARRTGLLGGTAATVGFPDIGLQGFKKANEEGRMKNDETKQRQVRASR